MPCLLTKKARCSISPGVHIVTANSFISNDGTLVMSMGAGLSLKTRYPDMPKVIGAIIREDEPGPRPGFVLRSYAKA